MVDWQKYQNTCSKKNYLENEFEKINIIKNK